MIKYLLIAFLATTLAACAAKKPETIEISTKPVQKPVLSVPRADTLKMRKVKWIIITEKNFKEKTAELFAEGNPVTLFALTERGYENLSLNINDLRTHIEQKNRIIIAYDNYYVQSDSALDNANTMLSQSRRK